MGVVQNSIDIEKCVAEVMSLAAAIGDESSGIIKDIDDLQEANALIMNSVSSIKTTANNAKEKTDQLFIDCGSNTISEATLPSQLLNGMSYGISGISLWEGFNAVILVLKWDTTKACEIAVRVLSGATSDCIALRLGYNDTWGKWVKLTGTVVN